MPTWYTKTQTDTLLGAKANLLALGGGRDLVEGVDIQSDGHSYGTPGAGGTNSPRTTWFQRVQARARAASYTNLNVSGAQAPDAAGKAAASATVGFRGVVLWDCTINDANRNGTSGTAAGFQAGLLTWLLIRRAAAKFEAEAYATETGTWTAVSDSYASGGTLRQTVVQSAKQSYAVSGATKWFLLVAGGVGSNSFGTAVVAVDGTTVSTVPLTGIYAATQNNPSRTWFPYAIPVTVPDTNAHTITITKTDSGSGPVAVDALYAREVSPPLILLNKAIYPVPGLIASPASSATVDAYNAAIDTVISQVATDGTIITMNPQAAGFSAATMTNDGLHPNNLGAGFIASLAQRTLDALTPTQATALRIGVDYNGTAASTATVTAPTAAVSDNFNRADSTTSLGTATTGQTWNAVRGTWGISGNKAYSVSKTDNDVALLNTGLTDQHASVTVSNDTSGVGLIVRSDATGANCYLANVSTLGSSIYKAVGGTYSRIDSNGGGAGTVWASGDILTMNIVGSTLTVAKNGTVVYTITDTAVTTGTYAGFRQGGTATQGWDDFAVN